MTYYSNPPGARLIYPNGSSVNTPITFDVAWTDEYKNGGCIYLLSPEAVWPDGARVEPVKLNLCREGKTPTFKHIFLKPALTPTAPPYQQAPSQGMDLNQAKNKCNELGFKMGTEAFGNCVLKMSK
jgi:hypothetical protein